MNYNCGRAAKFYVRERKVEYASSGRSTCKGCNEKIDNAALRIGLGETNGITSVGALEGFESIKTEDKNTLENLIKKGSVKTAQGESKPAAKPQGTKRKKIEVKEEHDEKEENEEKSVKKRRPKK